MRTNIVLDEKLIEEAFHLTHSKTKKELIDLALRELVARRKQEQLASLVGQELIAQEYDVRQVRAGMTRDFG